MGLGNFKIHFISTGGTIDGLEYSTESSIPSDQRSILGELLKKANLTIEYEIKSLIFKDSKFITDADRELLSKECAQSIGQHIIITHGTESMTETGEYLKNKAIDKVLILVGSMKLGTEPDSDALFNLGSAIAAAQLLTPGVYITMNGKIFEAGNVKKNKERGVFEDK